MAERTTAEDRLHRLLHVLPAAAREGGAPLAALARDLGVDERTVMRDLQEAGDAAFHRPAGSVDPFTITVEAEPDAGATVHVHTSGDFHRPARLTPRESLALVLGLRAMAADVVPEQRDAVLGLADRMDAALGSTIVQADAAAHGAAHVHSTDAVVSIDTDAILADAAARRRAVALRYVKSGDAPDDRTVEPWQLVHAEGRWYVLGRDIEAGELRLFRIDRVLHATVLEDRAFEVPADFDPAAHLPDGIAFRADTPERAKVRYEDPAARWIAEAHGLAREADGCVIIDVEVADRTWLVRRVLAFGGAAVVLEPEDLRAEVRERAARILG